MKKFKYILLGLVIAACGGQPNTGSSDTPDTEDQQSELQAEVMAIHDEVMPEMSTINRISRELRAYLENQPDLAEDKKAAIEETVTALEQADESMMDWMAAYGGLTREMKEMEHEAIMKALETEKEKITKVRDQMRASIKAGEQLLSEIEE